MNEETVLNENVVVKLIPYSSREVETFYHRFTDELSRQRMLSLWQKEQRFAGYQLYENTVEGRQHYYIIVDYIVNPKLLHLKEKLKNV